MANSITETYDSEVKMLKAELLLNEGKLEEAQQLINTIEDTDDLASIIEIVYLYMDMGYPEAAKEWRDKTNMAKKKTLSYFRPTIWEQRNT